MKIRHRHPTTPKRQTLITRCTLCSEEITQPGPRCLYCGALLSDPLAVASSVQEAVKGEPCMDAASGGINYRHANKDQVHRR